MAPALPSRGHFFAPTQVHTIPHAVQYILQTKAKLVQQAASRPIYQLAAGEQDEYRYAFYRLSRIARRVDEEIVFLYLCCSQTYIDDILEIIISVQSQRRLQHGRKTYRVLMTLADVHSCMVMLEEAVRIKCAIREWTTSEDGIRLQRIASDVHLEMLGSFMTSLTDALSRPPPPKLSGMSYTGEELTNPLLADLEIDGIFDYSVNEEAEEAMDEILPARRSPSPAAPSGDNCFHTELSPLDDNILHTELSPLDDNTLHTELRLKRCRDEDDLPASSSLRHADLVEPPHLCKRIRTSMDSGASVADSDITLVAERSEVLVGGDEQGSCSKDSVKKKTVNWDQVSIGRRMVGYGRNPPRWPLMPLTLDLPLSHFTSSDSPTESLYPEDAVSFCDLWSDTSDGDSACSSDSFVTAEDLCPGDMELCDEEMSYGTELRPPPSTCAEGAMTDLKDHHDSYSKPSFWRRILTDWLWIFR